MYSVKGMGLKIFASILAVAAICTGIYFTFFQTAGFKTKTATIIDIRDDPDYIPDPNTDDRQYITTVKFTADGKEYTAEMKDYSPFYKVGAQIKIYYDPAHPTTIHGGRGVGIYAIIIGVVILFVVIFFSIRNSKKIKKLKEESGETVYAPSEKGDNRELYFLTDLGTPKYGHRIEDKDRKVLYEAKMTHFSLTGPFGFDFIDHENGKTAPHLVGHEEHSDYGNSFLLDNHYTFNLDGEDIWKHLRRNGINVDSSFASGKIAVASFRIFRDNELIATMENTSQYVHEEDAGEHSVKSLIPVQGFYRIQTREKNLDLLFVVCLAFARSGASDDRGGSRRILVNTLADHR